jgi:type I restriction enzyme S subunit
MAKLLIPVPPIEVQREIVKVLDTFTKLEARRRQYQYYRDRLLSFNEFPSRGGVPEGRGGSFPSRGGVAGEA